MIIKVIASNNKDAWYSECVGDYFYAFRVNDNLALIFSYNLLFYPEDVEIVKGSVSDPLMPSIIQIGIS